MKKILLATIASAFALTSCVDLNLAPLSEGSSETWYSTPAEIEMSVNDFYRTAFFPINDKWWGDDATRRSTLNIMMDGSMTAENGTTRGRWENFYKGIARALRLLSKMDAARAMGVSEATITQYEGEAYFYLGFAYGNLAFHWGDAILDKVGMTLDEAYTMPRSPKAEVLAYAYSCFDEAAKRLPESHSGLQRATKGAAYAFKARTALWCGDYAVAATAAKDCMDLKVYQLHENYQDLFTASWSNEWIFLFRGDVALKQYLFAAADVQNVLPRLAGGGTLSTWGGVWAPSYELICAYPCIDGKPIDESPLYNPKDFFENRDPRLAMTVVPFATAYNKSVLDGTYDPRDYEWMGVEHTPDPTRIEAVYVSASDFSDFDPATFMTDKKIVKIGNNDSKARAEHAAYNGFNIKKFVDASWLENGRKGAPTTYPYMRYGDVLLMYAEAMIEQNKCTQEVLDATVNKLRERAYAGTGIAYPKVVNGTQAQMRTMIRTERFIEMALEGWRYEDLIRWRLAEKVFNTPTYFLDRSWSGFKDWDGDITKVPENFKKLIQNWKDGNYPLGGVPQIDENGIADLSEMVEKGYIVKASERNFNKDRDYLWPVPAADRLINDKLDQNPKW